MSAPTWATRQAPASPTTSTFMWCRAGAETRTSRPPSTTSRSPTRRWLSPRSSSGALPPKRTPAAADGGLALAVLDDCDVTELAASKGAEVILHPGGVCRVRGVGAQRRGLRERELGVPPSLLAPRGRGG